MHRWWDGLPGERFWVEITDRERLGENLWSPQNQDDGRASWSYSLLKEVSDGDIVFHYHKPEAAIVAASRAVGSFWDEPIVWAAHGTVARDAGVRPYQRPGWKRGLEARQELSNPVALDDIRDAEPQLRLMRDELVRSHGKPVYFPLELSNKRPTRPVQGYLAKLPKAFVDLFPSMKEVAEVLSIRPTDAASATANPTRLGVPYRSADEDTEAAERDAFSVDPSVVERGLRGHATTQNWLALEVDALGWEPRSPRPEEPSFDLAWQSDDGTVYVAEVKSTTVSNEEKQLRLGLGQVLRYRQLMSRAGREARAVLAIEVAPTDGRWRDLCQDLGVTLVWPGCSLEVRLLAVAG